MCESGVLGVSKSLFLGSENFLPSWTLPRNLAIVPSLLLTECQDALLEYHSAYNYPLPPSHGHLHPFFSIFLKIFAQKLSCDSKTPDPHSVSLSHTQKHGTLANFSSHRLAHSHTITPGQSAEQAVNLSKHGQLD